MKLGWTRLDWYLVREALGPLLFGIGAFTSLFVSGDLLNLANLVVEIGAPIVPALKVFLLKMPQVVVWTLPMSMLLATLLSLSRLSATSEIVAMRAGGVSLARIALPILALSLAVSGLGFLIGETIVPSSNERSRVVMIEEVRGSQLPTVTQHVVMKGQRGGSLDWLLYANSYDSRTRSFDNATLVYMQSNQPVQTAFADRIVWRENAWVMEEGVAYHYSPDGSVVVARYPSHSRPVDLGGQGPDEIARLQKEPEEMSLVELQRHIKILRAQGADVRSLEVQKHLKYSIPLAGFFFAVVGVPLGIQSHRSASSIGFGLSIIIIFGYYVLMTLGSALGQGGLLPPFLAAWMQNILMGGYGLWMIRKKAR